MPEAHEATPRSRAPRTGLALGLGLLSLAACAPEPRPSPSPPAISAFPAPDAFSRLQGQEIHEPRLILDREGSLLLVWRRKVTAGSDVLVARLDPSGRLGEPLQVNDEAGTVASYPHDEMRPAVAVGSNGRIAVGWTDSRGQVRAVESRDGGRSFSPSFRLEQVDAPAYRGFPELAYDDGGVLHAVWIDSRFAEGMAEEPADLFYARVADGVVTELNLTSEQEPTVCGCCRPALEIAPSGAPRALFRNADDAGYRDIFTVTGSLEAGFSAPRRVGQPLWKLQGCPMSGPASVAGTVLWPDGSSGSKRLMAAGYEDAEATPLFAVGEADEWTPRLSPRRVTTASSQAPLILLPGRPSSRLLARRENGWYAVGDELPNWASSAYWSGEALLVIGGVSGELRAQTLRLAL